MQWRIVGKDGRIVGVGGIVQWRIVGKDGRIVVVGGILQWRIVGKEGRIVEVMDRATWEQKRRELRAKLEQKGTGVAAVGPRFPNHRDARPWAVHMARVRRTSPLFHPFVIFPSGSLGQGTDLWLEQREAEVLICRT